MRDTSKKHNFSKIALVISLVIIATLATLEYNGYIDLFGLNSINTNQDININREIQQAKCPTTSCDTGTCCHKTEDDQKIDTNIEAVAVLTYNYCGCPEDTTDTGVIDNTTTPGIAWKICKCN